MSDRCPLGYLLGLHLNLQTGTALSVTMFMDPNDGLVF